jgi:hypothetical protein
LEAVVFLQDTISQSQEAIRIWRDVLELLKENRTGHDFGEGTRGDQDPKKREGPRIP